MNIINASQNDVYTYFSSFSLSIYNSPEMAYSHEPNDNEKLKVLIVGAGIAGLASVRYTSPSPLPTH